MSADEILIAEFEQETYGAWHVKGEAFQPELARGTLPGQMAVSGFQGARLVNIRLAGLWIKPTGAFVAVAGTSVSQRPA